MRIPRIFSATAALATAAAALTLAGCLKQEPAPCFVTLAPDWSARTEGVDPPAEWTVRVGDYTAEADGATHTVDAEFAPGPHTVYVYNPAGGIDVNGTAVSAARAAGAAAGTIDNSPGWFFSGAAELDMASLVGTTVPVPMRQQVRLLTLTIETDDDLANISGMVGTLSGVAGSFDMATGVHGAPSTVALEFIKTNFGDGPSRWRAAVRLLGVVPSAGQRFSATVTFTDPATGATHDMTWQSDLTLPLGEFNSGKEIPLTLEGRISPRAVEPGFTGTIDDWNVVSGGSLTAQ